MLEETRYILISTEEREYIDRQFSMHNAKIMSKLKSFRSFGNWRYEISVPFKLDKMADTFRNMSPAKNSVPIRKNEELFNGDKHILDGEPVQIIGKIKLLNVSQNEIKAMVALICPGVTAALGMKHIGRHTVHYTSDGELKIIPAGDDVPSSRSESRMMTTTCMMMLLYKLYQESIGKLFKPSIDFGHNLVYLNRQEVHDIFLEAKEIPYDLYALKRFPLHELTLISNGMFESTYYDKTVYGNHQVYFKVIDDDDSICSVEVKCYAESQLAQRHLHVKCVLTWLKDDDEENEVEVQVIEDTENGPLTDEQIFNKQAIGTFYCLVFQYLMYCMAMPKKTVFREITEKQRKKNPSKAAMKEKVRDEVTILIKNTGYIPPRNPVLNPGSGTKHSYEYERAGCWCVRKSTGKRYWRKSSTCCKGRGQKATHIYEIKTDGGMNK